MDIPTELRAILGSPITSLGRHPMPGESWTCTIWYQVDALAAALLLKRLSEEEPKKVFLGSLYCDEVRVVSDSPEHKLILWLQSENERLRQYEENDLSYRVFRG